MKMQNVNLGKKFYKLMKEQLPAFVLAELFSKSLVYTGENFEVQSNKKEPSRKELIAIPNKKNYLGNYEKRIVVLVEDEKNMHLDDESLQFLSGILNACKLNIAHIALINFNKNKIEFNQLKKDMQPEYLILFGINTLQIELPFAMPNYKVQFFDNCNILIAPSLIELNKTGEHAKAQKTQLWKSLKNMFNIG
jgi:hypothetical protein